MNLGFVPGLEVTVARSSPGGDPRVYRVEGTEVAMRRDLSRHIHVELARRTRVRRLTHGSLDDELPCGRAAPG